MIVCSENITCTIDAERDFLKIFIGFTREAILKLSETEYPNKVHDYNIPLLQLRQKYRTERIGDKTPDLHMISSFDDVIKILQTYLEQTHVASRDDFESKVKQIDDAFEQALDETLATLLTANNETIFLQRCKSFAEALLSLLISIKNGCMECFKSRGDINEYKQFLNLEVENILLARKRLNELSSKQNSLLKDEIRNVLRLYLEKDNKNKRRFNKSFLDKEGLKLNQKEFSHEQIIKGLERIYKDDALSDVLRGKAYHHATGSAYEQCVIKLRLSCKAISIRSHSVNNLVNKLAAILANNS